MNSSRDLGWDKLTKHCSYITCSYIQVCGFFYTYIIVHSSNRFIIDFFKANITLYSKGFRKRKSIDKKTFATFDFIIMSPVYRFLSCPKREPIFCNYRYVALAEKVVHGRGSNTEKKSQLFSCILWSYVSGKPLQLFSLSFEMCTSLVFLFLSLFPCNLCLITG